MNALQRQAVSSGGTNDGRVAPPSIQQAAQSPITPTSNDSRKSNDNFILAFIHGKLVSDKPIPIPGKPIIHISVGEADLPEYDGLAFPMIYNKVGHKLGNASGNKTHLLYTRVGQIAGDDITNSKCLLY